MTKHMAIFVLALLIVVVLLASTVFFQVDQTRDIVLVKTFSQVTALYQPLHNPEDAGLHFKWPWPIQQIVRYDSRINVMEDPEQEIPTKDKQNVLVNMYCAWRIADPKEFNKVAGTFSQGQDTITARLQNCKRNIIGEHDMSDLVNTEKMQLKQVEADILAELSQQMKEYGVEITRVGIKTLALSEKISQAVIDTQIKERAQEAERYRANGDAQALAIRSRAEAASSQIMSFAARKADNIATEGVRDSARYYSAFQKNERLSMFLRSLDSLRKELKSRAIIILPSDYNPALNFFKNAPSLEAMKPMALDATPKLTPASAPAGSADQRAQK